MRSFILSASTRLNVLIQYLPLQSLFWTKTWRAFQASDPIKFFLKMVIFMEDLLRRDSGNKLVLKEVPDLHTNFTSLDENLIPQNLQIYKEALRTFDRVPRYPN